MDTWWREQTHRYPLLSHQQELQLGAAIQRWLRHPDPVPPAIIRQGRRARETFIRCNLRLVGSVVDRYRWVPPSQQPDLIQAGNEGLIRGVEKFDPTRGYKFSTYGYWWIRQGVNKWLSSCGRTIRLPVNHAEHWTKLATAAQELVELLGRQPTRQELSDRSRLSVDEIGRLLERPVVAMSLDAPVPALDGDHTLGENLPAPDDGWMADDRDELMAALQQLPDQHRAVLMMFYGLGGYEPMNCDRIGAVLGIKGSLARDRLARGRDYLRAILQPVVNDRPALVVITEPEITEQLLLIP